MKLTHLLLGLVLSSGLFGAACGSSDSSNDSPLGGGGAGGTNTYTSGNWTCSDFMACKSGKLQLCCMSNQCKYVLGSKEYPCTGQADCESATDAAVSQCL